MPENIISVRNLSKLYRLGETLKHDTLRDRLADGFKNLFQKKATLTDGKKTKDSSDFWALKDVSFDIKPGEVVGIIGRNGAGKSTLLKVLSQITEPTAGEVRIRGRVASLLEVGTGFHPELTGRENIFLNGAILGMSQAEIRKKFDEIVAFAEVEKFLDTPVKRYSSGMYVRLAFAVAAHLQPEILLVDEVLAVGDASFQRKCLGKMESVSKEGRTVFYVSHNMPSVTRLCSRAILLNKGQIVEDGPAEKIVHSYLNVGVQSWAERIWEDPATAPGSEVASLRAVRIKDEHGKLCSSFDIRKPIFMEMEFQVKQPGHKLIPNVHVFNDEGLHLFAASDTSYESQKNSRPVGLYKAVMEIPGNLLSEGCMIISPALSTMDPVRVHFFERDAAAFTITDPMEGGSARGDYAGPYPGAFRPLLKWTCTTV